MPLYEYACKACDLKFEVRRGFNESSSANCPNCQCQAQRIFSPVPIVFKGPGFYVTDHARDGRNGYNTSKGDGDRPAEKVEEPAKNKAVDKTAEADAAKPKPAEVKA